MYDNNGIIVPISVDTVNIVAQFNQVETIIQKFQKSVNQSLVNISNNISSFKVNLATASLAMQGLTTGLNAIRTTIQATIGDFIKFGDALDKASARTGISVSNLSGLKFAAEQSGGNARSKVNKIQEPFSLTAGLGKTQNCTLPIFRTAKSRSSESTLQRSCNGLLTTS